VLLTDAQTVSTLVRRVAGHGVGGDAGLAYLDPARAVGLWRARALANAAAAPEARKGYLLPYNVKRAQRDSVTVPILPEEMV